MSPNLQYSNMSITTTIPHPHPHIQSPSSAVRSDDESSWSPFQACGSHGIGLSQFLRLDDFESLTQSSLSSLDEGLRGSSETGSSVGMYSVEEQEDNTSSGAESVRGKRRGSQSSDETTHLAMRSAYEATSVHHHEPFPYNCAQFDVTAFDAVNDFGVPAASLSAIPPSALSVLLSELIRTSPQQVKDRLLARLLALCASSAIGASATAEAISMAAPPPLPANTQPFQATAVPHPDEDVFYGWVTTSPSTSSSDSLSFEKNIVDTNAAAKARNQSILGHTDRELVIIETQDLLFLYANDWAQRRILAVDMQGYQDRTCLLQISTEQHDFIIDVIKLWHIVPTALKSILSSPHIVKIVHDANHDVKRFKKDFGIEICGMFDTYIASGVLLKSRGLALSKLVEQVKIAKGGVAAPEPALVTGKKKKVVWSARPLPFEMVEYARYQTCYLFDVYVDCVGKLMAIGEFENVLHKSQRVCKRAKKWNEVPLC